MDTLNPWFTVGLLVFGVYVVFAVIGSRDRSRDSAASRRPHGAPPHARTPES
jgi:hypothetical protein